jgi:threonine/homoserine/homoserine lactone efflux protein
MMPPFLIKNLPPLPLLATFLAASLILAITPGPGVLYIVTRSLGQGRRAGLASVIGVALGNFGNAVAASTGLATVLAISRTAFISVKYAGALYFMLLGVRALKRRYRVTSSASTTPDTGRLARDGFLVALLNPKTALFFAAFLPQFISATSGSVIQTVALGTLFVLVACITDTLYALTAGALAPVLAPNGGGDVGRYMTGGTFIGLGIFAAVSDTRTK